MPKWIEISVVSEDEPAPEIETEVEETAPAAPSSGSSSWLAIGGTLFLLSLAVVAGWYFGLRSGNEPAATAVSQPPGEPVPMPASGLANQSVPLADEPAAPEAAEPADDSSADAVSAEVARRLASDKRVAIVNGEPITEAMLEREVSIGRVLFPLLQGIPVGNDAQTLEQMRTDLLSSMIDERLLVQAAQEAGISVSEADLDARFDELEGRVGLSVDDLSDQLSAVGISVDDLRTSLRSTMLAERFVIENPPPDDVSAKSAFDAWVKALQKQGDVQVLVGDSASKTAKIGQPAPDFTLRGPDDEAVSLSDFAGQPLIVNFWATWCPPCEFEMPLLQDTYTKFKDDGLVVLGVDVQEGPELVNPYAERMGLTFPMALDRAGSVANAYRVTGLPTTVFVDSNGIVTDIHRGALVESSLQRYLDNILGE